MIINIWFFHQPFIVYGISGCGKTSSWPKLLLRLLKPGMESILEGKLSNRQYKIFNDETVKDNSEIIA